MGQVLSGLGSQYGGGQQRRPLGPGQNTGGGYNPYAPYSAGFGTDPNGPGGQWPGYYLGSGGPSGPPTGGNSSGGRRPVGPGQNIGGGNFIGAPKGTGTGNVFGPPSGNDTYDAKDPLGIGDAGSGGGVESTPDPLGPMTAGPKDVPETGANDAYQNPMRRPRSARNYSPEYQGY